MAADIQRGLPGLAKDAVVEAPGKPDELDATALPLSAWPPWFTPSRYTRRANAQVAAGRHPTGEPLGPDGETCGSCCQAYRVQWRTRAYWKCRRRDETRGPGSDLRKRWRACRLWRGEDDAR